jgi:hypothetical protein
MVFQRTAGAHSSRGLDQRDRRRTGSSVVVVGVVDGFVLVCVGGGTTVFAGCVTTSGLRAGGCFAGSTFVTGGRITTGCDMGGGCVTVRNGATVFGGSARRTGGGATGGGGATVVPSDC